MSAYSNSCRLNGQKTPQQATAEGRAPLFMTRTPSEPARTVASVHNRCVQLHNEGNNMCGKYVESLGISHQIAGHATQVGPHHLRTWSPHRGDDRREHARAVARRSAHRGENRRQRNQARRQRFLVEQKTFRCTIYRGGDAFEAVKRRRRNQQARENTTNKHNTEAKSCVLIGKGKRLKRIIILAMLLLLSEPNSPK